VTKAFRVLLAGLALCGAANAFAEPRIDLAVVPAWSGWARPGRPTEVDLRLTSSAATPATVDAAAGRQTVRARVELEPGRTLRLPLPLASPQGATVEVTLPGGTKIRREVRIAL
jgi:hypothetical protein